MKRSTLIMNAVAAAACFFLLSRPDRLWSSVPPDFDGAAMERLSPYSVPVLESADNRPSKTIKDRVYGLYGIKSSEGTVLNGEHLDQVLRRAGVSPFFSAAFAKTLSTVFDLRTMRPGDRYQVWAATTAIC